MPNAPRNLPRPPVTSPRRGSTTARGYGWAHQKQRARLIKERPVCERCRDGWSKELHHRDRNPFNRDDSNAEMICEACHLKEHGR